jgi:hypothetical protein
MSETSEEDKVENSFFRLEMVLFDDELGVDYESDYSV